MGLVVRRCKGYKACVDGTRRASVIQELELHEVDGRVDVDGGKA